MSARSTASLFSASVLLASSAASAQSTDPTTLCPTGQGQTLIRGTVGYELVRGAIANNAIVYGAASLAGNKLLPILADPEGAKRTAQNSMGGALGKRDASNEGIVIAFDLNSAFNVLRVPICTPDKADTPGPKMAKTDLSSFSYGFGIPLGSSAALYFAGSTSIHTVGAEGGGATRATYALGPIAAFGLAPVALFKRRFERDDFSMIFDYVAGLQVRTRLGGLSAGYVGSQGVFGNFTEPFTTTYLTSVVNQLGQATQVPYVELGLHALGKSFGADLLRETSLYGRRLQYPSVARSGVDDAKATGKQQSLTTAHLEQRRLGPFSVSIAGAYQPKPDLYEASVGYRSGNFGVVGGVVKLPSLWYYGIEGGMRARGSLDFVLPGTPDKNGFAAPLGKASLSINDPAFLAAFPYAYDAVTIAASFAGGF